jgi:hypothetical protein
MVICLCGGLAACGASAPLRGGPAPAASAAPSRDAHSPDGCPLGRKLPPGVGNAVDYVDFVKLGGRTYLGRPGHINPSRLGKVVAHVRCSLIAEEDDRRQPPPVIDGTAAFLRAGAAVYEIRGSAPRCRVAAYLDGRLTVYLAQRTVHGKDEPLPCALPRSPARQGANRG